MLLAPLSTYGVSPELGFLSTHGPAAVLLPEFLQPAARLAASLPQRIVAGRVRRDIEALLELDITELDGINDEAVLRTSLVHYAFLEQAYVWCAEPVPSSLPSTIARPLWALAERLGQPPILTYSQYVLDNWSRIDSDGPADLSNTYMVQPFLGGADEAWFVLIHVAIEAAAGPMLASIPAAVEAAAERDVERLTQELEQMLPVWETMNAAFDRMPDYCDPYVYFQRVRPWIHGFKDNPALPDGVVYEGVTQTGGEAQSFRGQTGSQSSIVPVVDALLGVDHSNDPLRGYLDELHVYRPPGHRRFIDEVRSISTIRDLVKNIAQPELTAAYNNSLDQLTRFRTRHLEYAASYINKQSRGATGNSSDVGTGGTPFMKYLKKHRDEANAHRL